MNTLSIWDVFDSNLLYDHGLYVLTVRKSKFDDIIGNDDFIDGDVRSNDVI